VTPEQLTSELACDARALLGEGPAWDAATGMLLWLDIDRSEVHRFDPGTGADSVVTLPVAVTALVQRAAGGFVATTNEGYAFVTLEGDPRVEPIAELEPPGSGVRMNDGKCDPAGRFWAGSMAIDESVIGAGSLYVLDGTLSHRTALRQVSLSNGLGWSPDGGTMYHVDSTAGTLSAYRYDAASGEIADGGVLVSTAMPDGLAVDAEGGIWVAFWGGHAVRRYSPEGELVATVEIPAALVTSCCFGGPDLADLYVTSAARELPADAAAETSAGGLFRVRPGVRGLAVAAFAG
jgi:sugar lactone lactonase YvrE